MRFTHVNHRYAPFVGGSERWIQEVSEALAQRGHQVSVVTTDAFDLEYFWDRRCTKVTAPRCEHVGGVMVHRVPVRHLPQSPIVFRGSRRIMGELSRLTLPALPFKVLSHVQPYLPGLDAAIERTIPADLMHATNVGIESLAIRSMHVAHWHRIPFLLTPFIHLGVDGDPVARRYVSMPHQLELMRGADAVIVMTEAEREFVSKVRRSSDRVTVAGAGVDVDEVTGGDDESFRRQIRAEGFLVGAVGAMAHDKGTFDLARAVIELRRTGTDVELVLAGPPLQAFVHWYTDLSDADREGIHLLGFVSSDVKRDLLAAIDVLALPSRTESFGIVYLEAWANCKPVIAADTPATRELIQDGKSGILVPFGSPNAIGEALGRLIADPAYAGFLGSAGREVTMKRHTWQEVVGRVAAVYSDVLDADVLDRPGQ